MKVTLFFFIVLVAAQCYEVVSSIGKLVNDV